MPICLKFTFCTEMEGEPLSYSTREIKIHLYVVFKFSGRGSTLKKCLEVEEFLVLKRKVKQDPWKKVSLAVRWQRQKDGKKEVKKDKLCRNHICYTNITLVHKVSHSHSLGKHWLIKNKVLKDLEKYCLCNVIIKKVP